MGYILKKNLGFEKENVIVINQKEEFSKNYDAFKNDLLQVPSIKNVAFVGSNLFQIPITTTDPIWSGKATNSSISFKILRCDDGFLPTMNIPLLAGRNFKNTNTDASNYIVNQKAMQAMGLTKENVIGAKLEMWNGKGEIIGLTDDFINANLHQNTEPMIMMFSTNIGFHYYLKTIQNANVNQTLTRLKTISKKYAPNSPFEYSFLDKDFGNEYTNETTQGKLSLIFTLVAIIICCLGLFGLATFTAEARTKEIGVRKVLGASVLSVTALLSKDFLILVLIATIIASPIAYYFMNEWLSSFAYRINIDWWFFALAGALAILIAFLTVVYQGIKAALMDPVKSLKTE
jgi:ABC-type antimicrobial peptide transport system permease subunit